MIKQQLLCYQDPGEKNMIFNFRRWLAAGIRNKTEPERYNFLMLIILYEILSCFILIDISFTGSMLMKK